MKYLNKDIINSDIKYSSVISEVNNNISNSIESANHPGFLSTRWYSIPGVTRSQSRNNAGNIDSLYLSAIHLGSCTLNGLAVKISSSGFIVGNLRLGVYKAHSVTNNEKLYETNIAISSAGTHQVTPNLQIDSGWYYLAYLADTKWRLSCIYLNDYVDEEYIYGTQSPFSGINTAFKISNNFVDGMPTNIDLTTANILTCSSSPYFQYNLSQ